MAARTISPELAKAVDHAREESRRFGQLRDHPVPIPVPPLSPSELAAVADWRTSGDYDRVISELVASDPAIRSVGCALVDGSLD